MAKASIKPYKGQLALPFELGENMTAGDPFYVYEDAGDPKIGKCFTLANNKSSYAKGYYNAACMLSSNTFVIVFRDLNNSNYGSARVGRIETDGTITWGTVLAFSNLQAYYLDVCSYAADSFCVVFKGVGNRTEVRAATVDVSLNITYGAAIGYVSTSTCYYNQIVSPAAGKICVCFKDYGHSNYLDARATTITGTSIATFGAVTTLETVSSSYIGMCSPAADKIACSYYASAKGYMIATTLTGTTVNTPGTRSEFCAAAVYATYCKAPTTDKIVVIYRDSGDAYKPYVRCCDLTGTTFGTWGTALKIGNFASYYQALGVLDTTHMQAIFSCDTAPYRLYTAKLTVSGTTLTCGNLESVGSERGYYVDCLGVSSDEYVLIWYQATGTVLSYALVVSGTLDTINKCLGILEETGSNGDTRKCNMLNSITKALSGMIIGEIQYIQDNGGISNVSSSYPIALALDIDTAFISKTIEG